MTLKLTALAWTKWQWLCHVGPTEVGAFGITSDGDPFLVEDLWVPPQVGDPAYCDPDDGAIGMAMEWAVDQGIDPARVRNVWLHTHPGDSARPSGTDEETFRDAYAGCRYAVMAILARGGDRYARVRYEVGGSYELDVRVLWHLLPGQAGKIADGLALEWPEEYKRVRERPPVVFDWAKWKKENPPARPTGGDRSAYRPDMSELVYGLDDESEADADEELFAAWLEDEYGMVPAQLTWDQMKQARLEYGEVYGTDDKNHYEEVDDEQNFTR